MFPVHVIDDTSKIPEDSICFLVSDKIYLKKNTGIIESLIPVDNISFKETIIPYAKLNIKKIPAYHVSKILMFFKTVTKVINSEAIVLVYYNPKTKRYKLQVPHQNVSFDSITYTPVVTPKEYILLSTIHSHNTFSAFHSSTDVHDEEGFDGLHITFGNVNSDDFSISASVVVNNMRFLVDPLIYLNGIAIKEVEETQHLNWGKWIKNDPKTKTLYNLNYDTNNIDIPNEWLKSVKRTVRRFNRRNQNKIFNNNFIHNYGFEMMNWDENYFSTFTNNDSVEDEFESVYDIMNKEPDDTTDVNQYVIDNLIKSNDKALTLSSNKPIVNFSNIMNYQKDFKFTKMDPCETCPFRKEK